MYQFKQEIQIDLPEQFKVFLVDDWENIVHQRKVNSKLLFPFKIKTCLITQIVKLPARHTVDQILEIYLKNRKKSDMYAVELCNGLREYFNCMLGSQLLYRYERQQYQEVLLLFCRCFKCYL
jgi:mortality factor 4-like protein 1